MRLAVERVEPPGESVLVVDLKISRPDNWLSPHQTAVTPRMVELAHEHGAQVLLLRPAYPAGEAMAEPELVCDRETFANAINLARVRAKELGVTVDAPHPHEPACPTSRASAVSRRAW